MTAQYAHPNVVQTIRTDAALTQKALADRAHLSTLYVIRAEQSMPVELGLNLASALSNLSNVNINKIEETYLHDREDMLRFYREYVLGHEAHDYFVETALGFALDNFRPVGFKEDHPFFLFRTKLCELYELPTSAIKFAAMFGVHPAIVSRLEKRQDIFEAGSSIDVMLRRTLGLNEVQAEMLRLACERSI